MKIKTYYKAGSIDEAYTQLTDYKDATIIAGGAWLKLLPKKIETAIDLSLLDLDQIVETEGTYEIGCMTTLRQLEKNESLHNFYDGILVKSISEIMGVPIRNIATIGGTIAGKFGFSDFLTPLLALDCELVFYKKGQITLDAFLRSKDFKKDILMKLIIHKHKGNGWFYSMKKTSNDFSILNVAVSKTEGKYKIAVGARPSSAKLAEKAMEYMNNETRITEDVLLQGAEIATEELTFGTNSRGSKTYREELCKALVKRGLKGVQR